MTTGRLASLRELRRIDWRHVAILYRREMRAAFREKTIVLNSVVIPIVLYPFLLWSVFTGMLFVTGQTEKFVSRVVLIDFPEGHPALRRALERHEKLRLAPASGPKAWLEAQLQLGSLDAVLEFAPPEQAGAGLNANFAARILYNQSRERSVAASKRLSEILEVYREEWLLREARKRGVGAEHWLVFDLAAQNVASGKEMGAFLLGLLLPIIFVVMVAIGCFYPAVDAVAGERERGTWETLVSTAANRRSIVAAKYFSVASLGGLAGLLNVVAVLVTVKPIFGPILEEAGKTVEFALPLGAVPVLVLAAVLLAGFVAAGMMIFASFARTFKEGQAMITPFYLLIMLPVIFLQVPGLSLTPALALVPVVNITLMVREAISGTLQWPFIGLTTAASLLAVGACVRLAAFILQFEDILTGSYSGSLWKFSRERLLRRAACHPPVP